MPSGRLAELDEVCHECGRARRPRVWLDPSDWLPKCIGTHNTQTHTHTRTPVGQLDLSAVTATPSDLPLTHSLAHSLFYMRTPWSAATISVLLGLHLAPVWQPLTVHRFAQIHRVHLERYSAITGRLTEAAFFSFSFASASRAPCATTARRPFCHRYVVVVVPPPPPLLQPRAACC